MAHVLARQGTERPWSRTAAEPVRHPAAKHQHTDERAEGLCVGELQRRLGALPAARIRYAATRPVNIGEMTIPHPLRGAAVAGSKRRSPPMFMRVVAL